MKRLVILVVSALICLCASAQIRDVKPVFEGNMIQYQKAEWEITLVAGWTNPYDPDEVALDMCFVNPDGSEGVLPCFYYRGDSRKESLWKARFTPRQNGEYEIRFILKNNGKVKTKTDAVTITCDASSRKGFLHPRDKWSFQYDDGTVFRGIGENFGWESRDDDDSKYFKALHEHPRFNYEYMITKLAQNGGNFFRTWMIYWNLPIDWKTPMNNRRYLPSDNYYNESAMEKMDRLVELCDSLGVHMMLALESHAGYMGTAWDNNNYNVKNGGYAQNPFEFFTKEESRDQYKRKLRLMIARYGYSPSIAVWELFNEVDHVMHDNSFTEPIDAEVISSWHMEMAEYIKANDPYGHMVSTSVSHRDIAGLYDIDAMDFNQRHIYGHAFTIPSVLKDYAYAHDKPYVIGECGWHWDWSLDFNEFANEFEGDFKKTPWLGLFSATPIIPMTWWWEFFEERGAMPYFKVVKQINDHMLSSLRNGDFSHMTVVADNAAAALGVKTSDDVAFAYIYYNDAKETSLKPITINDVSDGSYLVEAVTVSSGDKRPLLFDVRADSGILTFEYTHPAGQNDIIFIITRN